MNILERAPWKGLVSKWSKILTYKTQPCHHLGLNPTWTDPNKKKFVVSLIDECCRFCQGTSFFSMT